MPYLSARQNRVLCFGNLILVFVVPLFKPPRRSLSLRILCGKKRGDFLDLLGKNKPSVFFPLPERVFPPASSSSSFQAGGGFFVVRMYRPRFPFRRLCRDMAFLGTFAEKAKGIYSLANALSLHCYNLRRISSSSSSASLPPSPRAEQAPPPKVIPNRPASSSSSFFFLGGRKRGNRGPRMEREVVGPCTVADAPAFP